jgi:signal transduction histidine kinase
VIVGVAFAAAAFAPNRALARGGRHLVRSAGAAAIGVVALAELVDMLIGGLPVAIPQIHLAGAAQQPLALAVHMLVSVSLLISGSAFFLRSRPGDPDASLLAGAALLLSTAQLQAATMPMPANGWVTLGGSLRFLAYALLLVVAARGYARTRQAIASAAISAERQRIARDLHDGLAQDLALIAAQSQLLDSYLGPTHSLTIAARHAQAASRGAIVDLTASQAPSTAAALREVASELAMRFQVQINVSTELNRAQHEAGDLDSAAREEIVRIAREAIANAARHGGAHRIDVVLERSGRQVRLRVSDDGCGIAENIAPSAGGFGLPTMRARAEALGGRLTARRRPCGGTELEVRVSGLAGAAARGGPTTI